MHRLPAIIALLMLTVMNLIAQDTLRRVVLWQIGNAHQANLDLALAPDRYRQFRDDGFFVVGRSDSRVSWPYVHPGPDDRWAGSRAHTFVVLFGIRTPAGGDSCWLQFTLLDTHSQSPPHLAIDINGHHFEQNLPQGGGDASLEGHPEKGKPYAFEIRFPADLLRPGDNTIEITNDRGSWFLYGQIALNAPAGTTLTDVSPRTSIRAVTPEPFLENARGTSLQPLRLTILHTGDTANAVVSVVSIHSSIALHPGIQTVEVLVPAVLRDTTVAVRVVPAGNPGDTLQAALKPVRPMTIYLLPHSHTDIGYTEIQSAVEEKQMKNLLTGIEYARRTSTYPEGARFVWNVEVLWAADLYLHRMSVDQQHAFIDAVKKGWVGLNAMYLNELTGLCRPEELLQLFRFSTQLAERCSTGIDAAMISDVPGYTWGTVTTMAQAGIKYFSAAPNYFDRIGDILVQWENKPFYWTSPSGNERVLVWIPYKGYALSHGVDTMSSKFVEDVMGNLEETHYPYDITYLRWSGHGDNAVPELEVSNFVRSWNAKYVWPKFVIASTSTAFHAFEKSYGGRIPVVRGDLSPYWEDGAGSSALETAMNRASSDRLTQAEAAWAMLDPSHYPAATFREAWRNVLLYSEHTWGAWCSVSDPENSMTKEQWNVKRSYALRADSLSRALLANAVSRWAGNPTTSAVGVMNTCSWQRTELVVLPQALSRQGDRVTDDRGRPVPSQRLSTGQLAFLVNSLPGYSIRRYRLSRGRPGSSGGITVTGGTLDNGLVSLRVDGRTGAIVNLGVGDHNYVDTSSGAGVNDYLFLPGDSLPNAASNGPVTITATERGPLVAALRIVSEAPGCDSLVREVRLVAGSDDVEVTDTVIKKRAPVSPESGSWQFAQRGGKEGVHFAFPFNVDRGQVRLDIPLGMMRPELDQMPGSCKNWLCVGRWADVSNEQTGITLATLDAPLVEIGGITARLLGSQTNPAVWRARIEPTQKLYSWIMNNHWSTNYRAYQEGPVAFRYVLRPHAEFAPDAAARFATALSQPLIVMPAGRKLPSLPRLRVDPDSVTVICFKPSDDGKAWIIRLFGASGRPVRTRLTWSATAAPTLWLSDTSERPVRRVGTAIDIPAWDVVTLRAEFPAPRR